jgi:chemotaxis protein CheC
MENNNQAMTSFELDQLKEVINIGASHASTALSQLINKRVTLNVPEVYVDKVENIAKYVGNEKEVVTAVLLKILGDAPGMMTFLFPKGSENDLVKLLTKKDKRSGSVLDEFEKSALKEVGNILSGASLGAFSDFLNISMIQSVSEITVNMLGSIVNTVVAEIAQTSDNALIAKINMTVEGETVKTQLFFFIDPASTAKILQLTGQKI